MLVVALEAEEAARRATYFGEPEKYQPLFAPERWSGTPTGPYTTPVAQKILQWGQLMGAARLDKSEMARYRPDLVKEVYRTPEGTFIDSQGNPVEVPPGFVFVPAEPPASAKQPPTTISDVFSMFKVVQ